MVVFEMSKTTIQKLYKNPPLERITYEKALEYAKIRFFISNPDGDTQWDSEIHK